MTETAYDRVTRRLAEVLQWQPPRHGDDWRCPAHDDRNPSLSVTNGDGKVLLNCHGGCALEEILAVLQLTKADLFDEARERQRSEIVATYDYTDESGKLLYQVVRFAPKDFRQRRPLSGGGWDWKLSGTRRVLYRLPRLLEAVTNDEIVYIAEGEKDVHALERAGVAATTNPGGAGKWRNEYAAVFKGLSDVVVVADRDEPGRAHAEQVAASLQRAGVKRVRLAEPKIGKDAADHLGAGLSVNDFVEQLAEGAAQPDLDPAEARFFIDWAAFWAKDRREADWLFEDVLAFGRGHSLYASHKAGKSLLVLSISVQLTCRPDVVVVYLDYEMGEDDLYDRLADMGYGPDTDLSRLHYALLPSLPPLDEPEGAKALFAKVDAVQGMHPGSHVAVVIDTTGRAVAGEENSADTFRNFYRWTGLGLKQRGMTWARLDYAGKDATRGQRGSSGKGDDVDVVWRLNRTEDGIVLKREASRMGWVPEKVAFHQVTDPYLRFVRVAESWPAGTKEVAALLSELGVPLSAGERRAGRAMRENGHRRDQHVIRAAQRWRRQAAEEGARWG